MYELSHQDLQHISGGIDQMRASLEALAATVGYLGTRITTWSLWGPDAHPTLIGSATSTIGCGLAGHVLGNDRQLSADVRPAVGMTTSFLCSAVIAIGEQRIENAVASPSLLDIDWR